MNDIEILAPAGAMEQLYAAVRSGADAVYLGTKGFNARASAGNFDFDELKEAVKYCHARNVKVDVTVNTLVKDSEMNDLVDTAEMIASTGADAVILQDLAVSKVFEECCPGMARFASTQMSVHNLSGVRQLEDLGFRRAILARELSLKEIEYIASRSDIELEVFVHGALCMSVSGMCYLSSMIGGRSGNRGRCAQPCRLDFSINGRSYGLSLKDLCAIPDIVSLRDAGVRSLKIEGRLKRPEYVASAVIACRQALNGEEPDLQLLKDVFSRGGFTNGYLSGRRDIGMFGRRTPEDEKASKNAISKVRNLYREEFQSVAVDARLELKPDGSELTLSDGANEVRVSGDMPVVSDTNPLSLQMAETSVRKTGSTPFYIDRFVYRNDDALMLSISSVNAMRRQALTRLMEIRSGTEARQFRRDAFEPAAGERINGRADEVRLRFEKAAQIPESVTSEKVILPISEIMKDPSLAERFGDRLIGEIGPVVWPFDEKRLSEEIGTAVSFGCRCFTAENIFAVKLIKEQGGKAIGGAYLNIMNSVSLDEYRRMGLSEATASFELSMSKIGELRSTIPVGVIAYGFLPLMRLRSCPLKSEKGCAKCPGRGEAKDRTGRAFPLVCSDKRYTNLLNCVPLYLGDKRISADFSVLYFTTESKEECSFIIGRFKRREAPSFERTTGLYFREVE
ncbi:MAG: U32 family peptidase [Eubacteriales bacterium]|nr:U32 family peptidase [Eubacteriales bacterium]